VGFTVASLILGWFGASVRKSFIVLGGFFLHFIATSLMSLSKSFEFLMITAFAVGFANTLYAVGLSTILMDHTPSELMGRVASTRQVGQGLVRIVAPLIFGAIADKYGIRVSMLGMAMVGALGSALVVVSHPFLWRFDAGTRSSWHERLFGFARPVIGQTNPEFAATQQNWMSLLSLLLVFLSWLGLFYRFPVRGVGVFLVVLILAWAGAAIQRRKWLQGG
jgi:MFS family permease